MHPITRSGNIRSTLSPGGGVEDVDDEHELGRADTNSDGELAPAEVEAVASSRTCLAVLTAEVFDEFDADASGGFDAKEYAAFRAEIKVRRCRLTSG